MGEVFGPHVAGDLPQMDILSLYGLYSSREQQYKAVVDALPELERLILNETGGYSVCVNGPRSGSYPPVAALVLNRKYRPTRSITLLSKSYCPPFAR